MRIGVAISLILVLGLVAASLSGHTVYRFAISNGITSMNPIGKILMQELYHDIGVEVSLIEDSASSLHNFSLVEDGKADLCLGSNVLYAPTSKASSFTNVRTVLPLYQMALFIFCDSADRDKSLIELLNGRKVGLGPRGSNSAKLILEIFQEIGVDTSSYTAVYTPFDRNRIGSAGIEVACFFTGLFNPQLRENISQKHTTLFSLEKDPVTEAQGWTTTGICKKLWTNSNYILPKHFFGQKPDLPIYTLATQCCLYAHKDIPSSSVYAIVESVINGKSNYIRRHPALQDIDPNFNGNFYFPLHEGVGRYQERDKPSFFEKEAEPLSFGLTLITVLISLFMYEFNRRKRKRHRLEASLMEIMEASLNPSNESLEKLQILKRATLERLKRGSLKYDSELQSMILIFNQVEANIIKAMEGTVTK